MPAFRRQPWALRLSTLVLWTLCGISLAWWGLKLTQPSRQGSAPPAMAAPPMLDAQALARVLGADMAPVPGVAPAAPARFVLRGVLAGIRSGDGAALIAVDGKQARPYRVGAELEPGLVVQTLGRREAHLGVSASGPATMVLELPRRQP